MPSVNQGGGYTLTFAQKNKDVQEHLHKLKKQKVVITDYLCDAVRFYEKHKDDTFKPAVVDLTLITDLIKSEFANIDNKLSSIHIIDSKETPKEEVIREPNSKEFPTEESLQISKSKVGGFGKK
ncbi:MAG: hypothetical protein RR657_01735 [Peptostreptococcaceae bacterium]